MKFFIGIKIAFFDKESMTDKGIFMRVEQSEWLLKESEKSKKKKKATKTDALVENYSLAAYVKTHAFDLLAKVLITEKGFRLSTPFGPNVLSTYKRD